MESKARTSYYQVKLFFLSNSYWLRPILSQSYRLTKLSELIVELTATIRFSQSGDWHSLGLR